MSKNMSKKKKLSDKDLEDCICLENMNKNEESFWKEIGKIGFEKEETLKIWDQIISYQKKQGG